MAFYIEDLQDAAHNSQSKLTVSPNFNQLALADFNGDGYTDIFYLNDQFAFIYTAANSDDPSHVPPQGVTEMAQLGLGAQYAPQADPVTGDFNGDGALDVAWPGVASNGQWAVFFASVCPAAKAVVLGQTCTQAFQILLSPQTIPNLGTPGGIPVATNFVVLAAGNYDGAVTEDTGLPVHKLVVVRNIFNSETDIDYHDLLAYTFDAMLTPTLGSTLRIIAGLPLTNSGDQPVIASGGWAGLAAHDQLVFTSTGTGVVSVVTFDANLNMTSHAISLPGNSSPFRVFSFGLQSGASTHRMSMAH